MQAGGGTLHLGENPIGPSWDLHHYFLGADNLGRDVATLVLYGGRASLQIGVSSAVICCVVATLVALIAGFFGGLVDALLSRLMDVIWAFPVYLLAISISTELLTHSNGFQLGPLHVCATSLWTPTIIIALHLRAVRVPARPRPGAVGGQQGVRRRRHRAGRVELPADLLRHPAERGVHRDRPASADDRDHDPDRVGPVVPVDRRAAAQRELGHDHQRRPAAAVHPALGLASRPAS